MTLSVWRFAHLALAICSCIFLALAAVTGIILAVDAAGERANAHRIDDLSQLSLADAMVTLQHSYAEITEITVDHNDAVTIQAFDDEGNSIDAFINPHTGDILGQQAAKSSFIQWVTALHRSLFLKEIGRLFVGLSSFLLLLITVTGIILIIQRQHHIRYFFSKIVKENFAQYYHVVSGRLLLIPVVILAATGTYLSMVRFNLLPVHYSPMVDETPEFNEEYRKEPTQFVLFKNTFMSDIKKVEFPFSDDPEEFFRLKLDDRELVVDQFTGQVIIEASYPWSVVADELSFDLHTGRTSIVWAVILGAASMNILLFIWTGFTISLRRMVGRAKNKFKADECEYVILVGSENGSTLKFANSIHQQLLAFGQTSFLTEMNNYSVFRSAKHIVIFTSTYGLGDPPSDARKFLALLEQFSQPNPVDVSVVGFGSKAYPEFCKFAEDVVDKLQYQPWCRLTAPLFTVNDKSLEEFTNWVQLFNAQTQLSLVTTPAFYNKARLNQNKFKVTEKIIRQGDQSFIISLKPLTGAKFKSGDLLAIHPANDGRERFYSIGRIDNAIQLVVKLHPSGLGSEYLFALQSGAIIEGRIVKNPLFHFPVKAKEVIMISNGTGIAPFLGMITENKKKNPTHLYCGFSKSTAITTQCYEQIHALIRKQQVSNFQVAYSREGNSCYVMDLLKNDGDNVYKILAKGGVVMICGSMHMQQRVEKVIDEICAARNGVGVEYYKSKKQILADCY